MLDPKLKGWILIAIISLYILKIDNFLCIKIIGDVFKILRKKSAPHWDGDKLNINYSNPDYCRGKLPPVIPKRNIRICDGNFAFKYGEDSLKK